VLLVLIDNLSVNNQLLSEWLTKQNVAHLTTDDEDKYTHGQIAWTKTVSD